MALTALRFPPMKITAATAVTVMNAVSTSRVGRITVSAPATSWPVRLPTVFSILNAPLNRPFFSSGT